MRPGSIARAASRPRTSAFAMFPPPMMPRVLPWSMFSPDRKRFRLERRSLEAPQIPLLEHRKPRALDDVLREELADDRRNHEAVPQKPARLVELVDVVDLPEDGIAVRRHVVA